MDTRTKVCPICGEHFSYKISKGTDRKYCSAECREKYKASLREGRLANLPECNVLDCTQKATRVNAGLCEVHYCRLRRTGSLYKDGPAYRYKTGAGYIKNRSPEHPLSDSKGHVFEHRKVLYDVIGPGPHNCYWCGIGVSWNGAVVDHLNERKDDNTPANLVLCCNDCNRARGALLPFISRMRPERVEKFTKLVAWYNAKAKGVA